MKLHQGAHNPKELIDENLGYVAHLMKESAGPEIVAAVNGRAVLIAALKGIADSMEVLPWEHRSAREDAYIKVARAALKEAGVVEELK